MHSTHGSAILIVYILFTLWGVFLGTVVGLLAGWFIWG